MDELERNYSAAWLGILHELAGWTNREVEEWLASKPVDFSSAWTSHETATWYVVKFLIPSDVSETIAPELLIRLKSELEMLIERFVYEGGVKTDWPRLKIEVNRLIADFISGKTL